MTPEEIHAYMATEYAKQGQALADDKRRPNHFQVRLPEDMAIALRHYMKSQDLNANQALTIIITKFFRHSR